MRSIRLTVLGIAALACLAVAGCARSGGVVKNDPPKPAGGNNPPATSGGAANPK